MVNTVLNFTIRADTASAEGGAKRVGAAFGEMGGAASQLAGKLELTDASALKISKSLGLELSGSAERTMQKLESLQAHLIKTGAPAADLEKVTRALDEATTKYGKSLTTTVTQMGFWEQHGTRIAATLGTMTAGAAAFGIVAVKAFGESQKAAAQLDAVLESTGGAAGVTKEEVLKLADALSKVAPFDDEVIVQGQTLLLMFTNIGRDVFPRATKAMLDLAARMEIDVPSAAKMLGKALAQPAEGFTALAKATGKFTDSQVASIKEMIAMGETGKAQAAVLELVEKKVGGAAEALGKTLPGQLTIAQTAAGNFNEEIGAKLAPTLQGLIQQFPNVAAAAVGLHDTWGNLNISGGELLIAIPLLKTAFAGMGASLTGLVGASGPIALAIVGIGALAATVYTAVTAIQAFSQKQISMVQANVTAERATDALTRKAREYGIQLQKGNETQEQFNARLFQSIAQHERLNKATSQTTQSQANNEKIVRSHVITLQQQIDKQRALVESLSHQVGKDQELTEATAKLEAMLKKTNVTVDKVAEAWKRLPQSYDSAHKASQEWVNSAEREFDVLVRLESQLGRNITEMDKLRASTLALSEIDLSGVMISNNKTLEESAKRAEEATVSWEKLNEMIKVKTPEALAPAKQAFGELDRQVSTIVTDMGKGIADALIKWKGFGESMKTIAKEFGTGILRTFVEQWFDPLKESLNKLSDWISDSLKKVTDKIGGLFGGLGGGIVSGLAGAGLGVAASLGIGALIDRLTRRGREKTTATGAAEELSDNVWQNIIPEVESGNLSIEEGIAAINEAWAAYEKFLRANLKDQTVIQRSLDTQRLTLTEGLAALENLRGQLDTSSAVANLEKLGAQFMATGQMSEEFARAITEAGGSVEFFTQMSGQVEHLQSLRNEFAALKSMIDEFLPKQRSWMENFVETGEITEEMARKIREAGGDIEQFKKFAELKNVKTQFQDLVGELNKTGKASESLLAMIRRFGGAEAADAFERLAEEARKSGKTIGELAEESEGAAKVIQDALEATAKGIDKAFGDAAKSLSDTLAEMDENLGKAIASLQNAMVTMIKDLIDVLLGIPGAAEKAARDANFFLAGIRPPSDIRINITTHFDDSGLREAERRAAALSNIGITPQPNIENPVTAGGGREGRSAADVFTDLAPRRFGTGGLITEPFMLVNPRTGRTEGTIGESGPEAVVPVRTSGGSDSQTAGGVNLYFDFSGVVDREGMKRAVRDYVVPELASVLKGNTAGARVSVMKGLRLKQTGQI